MFQNVVEFAGGWVFTGEIFVLFLVRACLKHFLHVRARNLSVESFPPEPLKKLELATRTPDPILTPPNGRHAVDSFACSSKQHNLSKNQKIIFDLIDKSHEPLKAYSILFNVQKKGINAPLQVYRALDKLVEIGKIHKIESRNAFIACQNSSCQISKATAFSICESCEKVSEINNSKLSKYLSNFVDETGMKYSKYNLEFFGLCKKCKSK